MKRRAATTLLAWALLVSATALPASSATKTGFWKKVFAKDEPPVASRLFFNVVVDIPLPGPLPGPGPSLIDDRIELPVAGGVATMGWDAEAEATIDTEAQPPLAERPIEYSTDPSGKFRARFLPDGRLLMEKNCGDCKKGWNRKWRLRVPGNTSRPPMITDNRVYFGAADNRVYSLQRSNGHRLWDVDIGGRISKPLMLWSGSVTDGDPGDWRELIVALPDGGARIIALDARSGQELARFELPPDGGRIHGRPIATPDGSIIVAREKYNVEEASLIVLELASTMAIAPAVADEGAEPDPPPVTTKPTAEESSEVRQRKQ